MGTNKIISVAATFLLLICNFSVSAQCAMCRTTASSDLESGGSIANGLNTGIFYLMAIPYVILMIGGYFFFKKTVDAKVIELVNKLFSSK